MVNSSLIKGQRQYNGWKIVFSINRTTRHVQLKSPNETEDKQGPDHKGPECEANIQLKLKLQTNKKRKTQTFTKVNSKWITDLNVKCKAIKLQEDNIREGLDGLRFLNDFRYDPKGTIHEEKIEILDIFKIKNFF